MKKPEKVKRIEARLRPIAKQRGLQITICSVCGEVLTTIEESNPSCQGISHGLCKRHLAQLLANHDQDLKRRGKK